MVVESEQLVRKLKRLRTSGDYRPDEVRKISMQLAAIPDESAHKELYKMVRLGFLKRLRGITPHDAECQIIACEALAETGNQKALDFLTSLLESNKPKPYQGGHDHYMRVEAALHEERLYDVYSRLEKCVERARETCKQKKQK